MTLRAMGAAAAEPDGVQMDASLLAGESGGFSTP